MSIVRFLNEPILEYVWFLNGYDLFGCAIHFGHKLYISHVFHFG